MLPSFRPFDRHHLHVRGSNTTIEEVFVRRVQSLQILTVRSSCGAIQTLYTTQVHPVYINTRGWVDAAHIQVGDQILEPTGGLATVTASCFENYTDGILVYNFRVGGSRTYFVREAGSCAEPLWPHNEYGARRRSGTDCREEFERRRGSVRGVGGK
jgi:hypothetical protein